MSVITLGSLAIENKKKETLNAQNLRKQVAFRDIELVDDKTIRYEGRLVEITEDALKSLLKMIGMSQQFATKFGELFTPEAKTQFINSMKNAMATNKGNLNEVTLVLNPLTRKIVSFLRKPTDFISNERFIETVEMIVNQGNLDVTNWSVDPNSGLVTVNAFNSKAEFAIDGLANEAFSGGLTMKNSPDKGLWVMPYVNRQWCTNGLTMQFAEEEYKLHELGGVTMEKFWTEMNDLANRNFMPHMFETKVLNAKATPASMRELNSAFGIIKEAGAGDRAGNWIPLAENFGAYASAGIDFKSNSMSDAKSNQSIWSLVNSMTHFASHDIVEGVADHNRTKLMVQAGNLLDKKHDHAIEMVNPFAKVALDSTFDGADMI
jgi:hypothetical protein